MLPIETDVFARRLTHPLGHVRCLEINSALPPRRFPKARTRWHAPEVQTHGGTFA